MDVTENMARSGWTLAGAALVTVTLVLVLWPHQGGPTAWATTLEQSRFAPPRPPSPVRVDPPPAPTRPAIKPLADARRIVRPNRSVLVPAACGASGSYDLILHFHGAGSTLEPIFQASTLDAVVVITNLGLASGPYERMFQGRDRFRQILDAITSELMTACSGAKPRRIALSSWSAGYGAPMRILEHEANRERVDAVLLADGLHGALERRYPRTVSAAALEPIRRFAERAVRAERLLAITHSGIVTGSYASTTETADFLLSAYGIERELKDLPGPRPAMRIHSVAEKASLLVTGFSGNDADAHCDHLFAFGQTLLPALEARWNR